MSATVNRTPGETFAGYTQLEVLMCYRCGIMFTRHASRPSAIKPKPTPAPNAPQLPAPATNATKTAGA
jgi:hypothetical protein